MSGERDDNLGGEGDKDKNKTTFEERLKVLEDENKQLEGTNVRLLEQSQDWKKKAQGADEKDAERRKQLEDERNQEMVQKGEFKKLYEQRGDEIEGIKRERDEATAKAKSTSDVLMESRKLSAFENRLGGRLKNDKYLSFVNTQNIAVNPETNQIDPATVDATVKNFLTEHKELVNFQAGKMPNLDGDKGSFVTHDSWKGMNHSSKKENLSAAVENYKRKKR